jgi:hypothetical protein
MLPLDREYNDTLPRAVLEREFELACEHIIRNGE